MGANGRKLMEERYSVEAVAQSFEQLYKWILNQAPKPEFVFENRGGYVVEIQIVACVYSRHATFTERRAA